MVVNANEPAKKNDERISDLFVGQQIKNVISSLNIVDKFQYELLLSASNPGFETHASKIVKTNQILNLMIEEIKYQLSVELNQICLRINELNEIYEMIEQMEIQIDEKIKNSQDETNKRKIEILNNISEETQTLKQIIHERISQLESLITKLRTNIQILTDKIENLAQVISSQEESIKQLISNELVTIPPSDPINFRLPSSTTDNDDENVSIFTLSDDHLKRLYLEEAVNSTYALNKVSPDKIIDKIKNEIFDMQLNNPQPNKFERETFKTKFEEINAAQIFEVKNKIDHFHNKCFNTDIIVAKNNLLVLNEKMANLNIALDNQRNLLQQAEQTLDAAIKIQEKLNDNKYDNVTSNDLSSILESASDLLSRDDIHLLLNSPSMTESLQTNFNELMTSSNIESYLENSIDMISNDLLNAMSPVTATPSANEADSTRLMMRHLHEPQAKPPGNDKESAAPVEKGVLAESSYRPGLFGQSAQKQEMAKKKDGIENAPTPATDELKRK